MANWNQISGQIERAAGRYSDAIEALQEDYRTANGNYWQGPWTSDTIPEDGGELETDTSRHPHDQSHTWADVGFSPELLPCRIACEVEDGGFRVIVCLIWEGVERTAAWGFGVAGWDWIDCPSEP